MIKHWWIWWCLCCSMFPNAHMPRTYSSSPYLIGRIALKLCCVRGRNDVLQIEFHKFSQKQILFRLFSLFHVICVCVCVCVRVDSILIVLSLYFHYFPFRFCHNNIIVFPYYFQSINLSIVLVHTTWRNVLKLMWAVLYIRSHTHRHPYTQHSHTHTSTTDTSSMIMTALHRNEKCLLILIFIAIPCSCRHYTIY